MIFDDAVKIEIANFLTQLIEQEQEMIRLQPKDKEATRQQIVAETEAFLAAGGVIEILPPGLSTNLEHEEAWRGFSL